MYTNSVVITKSIMLKLGLFGSLSVLLTYPLFCLFAIWIHSSTYESMWLCLLVKQTDPTVPDLSFWEMVKPTLGGLACCIPLFLLHELCHGSAFRLAGKRPVYGIKLIAFLPVLYAAAIGEQLSRSVYLKVALAPALLISGLGLVLIAMLPVAANTLTFALSVHLAGCVGDFWMVKEMLKLPSNTTFEDKGEAFQFWIADDASLTSIRRTEQH